VIVCPNCGANVPPPPEVDATFATCNHCHFRVALSVQWVEARQRQQLAIDRRHHENVARTEERKSKNKERLVWTLGIGGIFVVVGGIIAVTVGGSLWDQKVEGERRAAEQAVQQASGKVRLAELAPVLERLKQAGCTHEVEAPHFAVGPQVSTLTMKAGGSCLHAVAASAGSVQASIAAPSGKAAQKVGQGVIDLEHCPAESGEHRFELAAAADDVVALAMLDCPPAFEKHKDDPAKNGLERAQARLAVLEKAGCKRVILPPKPVTGDRSLTASMEPGAFCTVLVASSGSKQNALSLKMTSPMGDIVGSPAPASDMELAYCAKVAGDHAVVVAPSNLDYYTLAAMECPRKVAVQHGAK
jgi:hypothetical protein